MKIRIFCYKLRFNNCITNKKTEKNFVVKMIISSSRGSIGLSFRIRTYFRCFYWSHSWYPVLLLIKCGSNAKVEANIWYQSFKNFYNSEYPLAKVPVLKVDGKIYCQTKAIQNYALKHNQRLKTMGQKQKIFYLFFSGSDTTSLTSLLFFGCFYCFKKHFLLHVL